jgi:DNA (cytosine-5)-methyltransferase 1
VGVATYGVKLRRSDDLALPPHPDSCTPETVADWAATRRRAGARLAVDLFAGAGGLSLGLQDAGWTVAAAVDTDPKSVATHRHNFPGLAMSCDLGDRNARNRLVRDLNKIGPIDLLAGGPPCQPFSRAGRSKIRSLVRDGQRDENDLRRELWRAFLHVALRLKPRAVLMENVPDMALGDQFRAVRTMIEELENAGYYTQLRLVDAWLHGVPQHRKRLILLARNDADEFPWPDTVARTTLRDAIGDLPELVGDVGARDTGYQQPDALPAFARRMRRDAEANVVHDHMTRPVRDDDRQIFSMMDSRTLYAHIPEELRRYTADTFDDKYKRLDWDDISRSITAHIAKDGYWYIHPGQPRTLTVREAARIQTFPDRFRFAGTRSDAFRQIGNAVPPLLGTAAATALTPQEPTHPQTAQRPRSEARLARQALARWAKQQRDGTYWYMFPGPGVTIPVAAAAALLTVRPHEVTTTSAALAVARGHHHLDVDDLLAVEMALSTNAARRAVRRLEPLTHADPQAWTAPPEEIAATLRLQSAQTDVFLMLTGHDVMLDNQSAIRVAARVAGSTSDSINRLTDGRTDLARLVGSGPDAPLRMAAVRAIGATICKEAATDCDSCPLARWCVRRRNDCDRATETPTAVDTEQ